MSSALFSVLVVLSSAPEAKNRVPTVAIPFGCDRAFPVSQAHHTGSHQHYDAHAWDFRMPDGEPIVAAADGIVRAARGDSTRGGCDISYARDANYVVISHEGGLETQYLHFSEVVVRAGDKVQAGDLLGYSGRTGWACGSHLHFKVAQKKSDSWNNPSVPAALVGYGDPQAGVMIEAPRCSPERPYLASRPPAPRGVARIIASVVDGSASEAGQGAGAPDAGTAPPPAEVRPVSP